jgi:hypothetical protein
MPHLQNPRPFQMIYRVASVLPLASLLKVTPVTSVLKEELDEAMAHEQWINK